MIRISLILGLLLFGSACGTPEQVAAMEEEEDMEQSYGNERSEIAAQEGGDMGRAGIYSPNVEEDAIMDTTQYPE